MQPEGAAASSRRSSLRSSLFSSLRFHWEEPAPLKIDLGSQHNCVPPASQFHVCRLNCDDNFSSAGLKVPVRALSRLLYRVSVAPLVGCLV